MLAEQGLFVSLPIPEVNKIYKSDTGRRYSDLRVSTEMTYLALMEQLGLKGDIADLEKVRKYEWKVQKRRDSVYTVLQGTQNILIH